jgi:predicted kinase
VYVLLNGTFGVGKTTVARELRTLLPGSAVFDPEWVGFVLRRLPGYARSDFQHLAAWRRLSVLGARLFGALRGTVIVPMAFSELAYLEAMRSALAASGRPVLHFCLTASLEVVRARLALRGVTPHDPGWDWVQRRAAECCRAHESPAFGVHVPTAHASAREVAVDLARRIRAGGAG